MLADGLLPCVRSDQADLQQLLQNRRIVKAEYNNGRGGHMLRLRRELRRRCAMPPSVAMWTFAVSELLEPYHSCPSSEGMP
jgi:hypothetical protein